MRGCTDIDICYPSSYTLSVIRSFRHKGLEEFFRTGSKRGIRPEQAARLKDILFRLHFARKLPDLDFPGANLHPLKGELAGLHAVNVSGNWRLVFRFQDGDALEIDYLDYH
ncbi:MAG: type II toxin-antitoxin system RelE/ParE family toxin [Nitrospirota bacterium]